MISTHLESFFSSYHEDCDDFVFPATYRMITHKFSALSRGPAGFRELREACRKIISTYPGTSPTPWWRVMGKNLENGLKHNHIDDDFLKKSTLDATTEHFRPHMRILRWTSLTRSNSEVYRSRSRSTYQEIIFFRKSVHGVTPPQVGK